LVASPIVKTFQAISEALSKDFRENTGSKGCSKIIFLSIHEDRMDSILNEAIPSDRARSRFQHSKNGFLET